MVPSVRGYHIPCWRGLALTKLLGMAKLWLRMIAELRKRGVQEILISVVDGLKSFPDAITVVFVQTQMQAGIIYLLRNSLEFAN